VAPARPAALIVEDDFRHAEMIRQALEDEGFETVHASDGATALRALAQRRFDLITLDLVMPGMDGWETLERLKAAPAAYGVPIVIISIVAEDNMRKGMSLGAHDVLQKPVDRAQLRALVQGIGLGRDDGRRRRVLVIDDDARNVDLLLTYLRDVPALDVSAAYDGQSGLEQALKQLPDLLIVDLMMPGLNGFEVVQALQKTPAAAAIPIIILTAKALSVEERQQLEQHVHGIFGKAQFTRQAFVNEVRRAMTHSRQVATAV
jgi:CheY-like chemotaxis protein